jgi:hypothetical protein
MLDTFVHISLCREAVHPTAQGSIPEPSKTNIRGLHLFFQQSDKLSIAQESWTLRGV